MDFRKQNWIRGGKNLVDESGFEKLKIDARCVFDVPLVKNGGTLYVRIPSNFVKSYKLGKGVWVRVAFLHPVASGGKPDE